MSIGCVRIFASGSTDNREQPRWFPSHRATELSPPSAVNLYSNKRGGILHDQDI
jgi:hypothetical protein